MNSVGGHCENEMKTRSFYAPDRTEERHAQSLVTRLV